MEPTTQQRKMNLSKAQRKVLANLNRTAFYGQNQKTFGALLTKGLIEFKPADERNRTDANMFRITAAGQASLR